METYYKKNDYFYKIDYENDGEKSVLVELDEVYDNICNKIHNIIIQPNLHQFRKTAYKYDFLTYNKILLDQIKNIKSENIINEYQLRYNDEYEIKINNLYTENIKINITEHMCNEHYQYSIPLLFLYNLYIYSFYRNNLVDKKRYYCSIEFEFQTNEPVLD